MVMMLRALTHRNDTSMRHFAHDMLELDRGVIDAKVVMQPLLDIAQDTLTHRWRNIGDRNMTGQSMRFRSDTPYMKVVYVVDSLDRANRQFDLLQLHAARRALHQNVQRLAHNA